MLLFGLSWLPLSASAEPGKPLVVIDPAHDGSDKGVRFSDDVYEKDVTLAIARSIQKELSPIQNLRVQLTRDSNRAVSIRDREQFVRNAAPDLFISLHINAGFGKKASGFEIYFPGFKGQAQSENKDSSVILTDMARNKHLNDSVRFAYILQKNLEQVFPRKGRGLREAAVPVLEGIAKPAIVIELGFVSNAEDKKQLLDKDIQLAIAKAISKSIKELF
ncbi:N-acetylmuramoyl-L-alanine amidase [Syntrophus gentianae]|uniref:N-acetylmuramoyl-L-alanine amidase n=1 Tax=Syntrophus gentianae TaxID=43775 RepID=A0A1H7ZS96_9BACT|nr:N-acetylmuramoyl-L-alanine amidase [Syntrophus gentianae]